MFTSTISVHKMNKAGKLFAAGLLVFTLLQVPAVPAVLHLENATAQAETVDSAEMANIIFGQSATTTEAQTIIEKQKEFVSTRKAYEPSLAVVEKHADSIKETAAEKGVPTDVAIGVAFLENGGSETAKSPAGALGIYQLMPGTARNLGMTVNKSVDERLDPSKSIEAGVSYLRANYERFGDWGLATWAYHAGEGNVAKAVKIYARANEGIELQGIKNFPEIRDYVVSRGITVHVLLSDPSVQKFTDKLNDDSAGYPYKVVATATLFEEKEKQSQN